VSPSTGGPPPGSSWYKPADRRSSKLPMFDHPTTAFPYGCYGGPAGNRLRPRPGGRRGNDGENHLPPNAHPWRRGVRLRSPPGTRCSRTRSSAAGGALSPGNARARSQRSAPGAGALRARSATELAPRLGGRLAFSAVDPHVPLTSASASCFNITNTDGWAQLADDSAPTWNPPPGNRGGCRQVLEPVSRARRTPPARLLHRGGPSTTVSRAVVPRTVPRQLCGIGGNHDDSSSSTPRAPALAGA